MAAKLALIRLESVVKVQLSANDPVPVIVCWPEADNGTNAMLVPDTGGALASMMPVAEALVAMATRAAAAAKGLQSSIGVLPLLVVIQKSTAWPDDVSTRLGRRSINAYGSALSGSRITPVRYRKAAAKA
jgi:hypothetical protein